MKNGSRQILRLESMRRRFMLPLVATLCLSAFQSESQVFDEQCQKLYAVASYDWYPAAFQNPRNRQQTLGVAVEILKEIAEEHDVRLEIDTTLPWSRGIMYMNSGQVDMLVGHYLSQERTQYWHVSKPLFEEDIRVYFHKDYSHKFNDVTDLEDLRGIYPRAASYGDKIDSYIRDRFDMV